MMMMMRHRRGQGRSEAVGSQPPALRDTKHIRCFHISVLPISARSSATADIARVELQKIAATRGIKKVRRPTQLTTRYALVFCVFLKILTYFNIFNIILTYSAATKMHLVQHFSDSCLLPSEYSATLSPNGRTESRKHNASVACFGRRHTGVRKMYW